MHMALKEAFVAPLDYLNFQRHTYTQQYPIQTRFDNVDQIDQLSKIVASPELVLFYQNINLSHYCRQDIRR